VEDHCRAVMAVLLDGRPGEVYNIGADSELANIDVVRTILDELGKPHDLIEYVTDRPGHDRRYAIDSAKIRSELDWKPIKSVAGGFRETVAWYRQNRSWWEEILAR